MSIPVTFADPSITVAPKAIAGQASIVMNASMIENLRGFHSACDQYLNANGLYKQDMRGAGDQFPESSSPKRCVLYVSAVDVDVQNGFIR